MVQKRRRLIENHDVHVIALQQRNDFCRQFCRVAERGIHQAVGVDVHRHVNVAVPLRTSAGLGAEKVSLEDLWPRTEASPQAFYKSLMTYGHACIIGPGEPRSNSEAPPERALSSPDY